MRIRRAVISDISAMADLSREAFRDDELFRWLCPGMVQHPEHCRGYFLRRHRMRFNQPGVIGFVAETQEGDVDWHELERLLLSVGNYYVKWADLDRAVSWTNKAEFRRLIYDNFSKVAEFWHLMILGVSPTHQRRGVGGMLVDQGLALAQEEGVPAVLEATSVGRGLYKKKGFREYSWMRVKEGIDGPTFIWEPKGMEGKWGTEPGGEVKAAEAGHDTQDPVLP
ncbi:MAG: hypothetical protein M1817_001096 [Caeruleum heppii]|nr:MAG: hypothetical protein M1817_001096 [Caeruleum heppii]